MISDNMLLLHGNNRYHAKEHEYQGTDIVAKNTYRAELGLKVYGKSTQNGVPSPANPIPINSIGDSGSVDVVVSDNNGNSQTLTINTPNGLCGIPVDTGGNYTDSTGQQWICDEVDLERGVKVQRVYQVDIDGENTKFKQAGVYVNLTPSGLPIAVMVGGQRTYAISTFTNLQWFYNPNSQFLYLMADNISDQLNASCKKQLGKVYYALATPIETPLTAEELAAYKAIKSYPHFTRIESAAELGVTLKKY